MVHPDVVRPRKVIRRLVRYMDKEGVEKTVVEYRVATEVEIKQVKADQMQRRMAQVNPYIYSIKLLNQSCAKKLLIQHRFYF